MEIEYILCGALTGLLVGLTGVGGGALMTPLLILFFHVDPLVAVSTDLWFASLTKMAGLLIHQRHAQVDWNVVRRLLLGSLPVTIIILLLISQKYHVSKSESLTHGVGAVVLLTSIGLFASPWLFERARQIRIDRPQVFKRLQGPTTTVFGAVLGACVSVTSVGAGAIGTLVLMLLYPLRMSPKKLVATDIAHAMPLALVIAIGYTLFGVPDFGLLQLLLYGSIPSVIGGSLLTQRLPARLVQLLLATVLLIVGFKTVLI
jgi:uncharacterized membrane protein YfcA